MKTLRPVMARLLLVLLVLQPAAVFAAQGCHDNGDNTGDHAHHAGMQHDQAPVSEHAEPLQCDCYCVGGCAQVCNAGAVPVSSTTPAVSTEPLLHGADSFLRSAHPEPHLRPPNHA